MCCLGERNGMSACLFNCAQNPQIFQQSQLQQTLAGVQMEADSLLAMFYIG